MTQRNALMELIEQARRLSKHCDMNVLNQIDYIFKYIWIVEPKQIAAHKDLLEPIIEYYHKPQLFKIISSKNNLEKYFSDTHDGMSIDAYTLKLSDDNPEACLLKENYKDCSLCTYMRNAITDIFVAGLCRHKKDRESLDILVCEIVDFMHERTELVSLHLIDEYMMRLIHEVCTRKNKINPLKTDLIERFGKYWKDKNGNWHEEKRQRFR